MSKQVKSKERVAEYPFSCHVSRNALSQLAIMCLYVVADEKAKNIRRAKKMGKKKSRYLGVFHQR